MKPKLSEDNLNTDLMYNDTNSNYSEEYSVIHYVPGKNLNDNQKKNINDNKSTTRKKIGYCKRQLIFLYDFFSYNTNLLHLTDIKDNNIYYNDKNMEMFTYIKLFLLFFIIFSQIMNLL